MNLSHLDWPSILVTAFLASLGAIAGMAIKQWFDRSLEEKKIHWERASWVHQRQVEALARIYSCLYVIRDYLQGAIRSGRGVNEPLPEQYLDELGKRGAVAATEYINDKLIIPKDVSDKCEAFFKLLVEAESNLAIGKELLKIGDGLGHMENRNLAAKIAFQQIPDLLGEIERSARQIIDEESKS